MPYDRTTKKILKWNPLTNRPKGRPKSRWEDNIIQNLRQMKIKNWITCVQDRIKWKEGCRWEGQNLQLKEVQRLMNKNKTHYLFKSADFLFQYKVRTLRLIVEHSIRKMSPTTLLAHSWRAL